MLKSAWVLFLFRSHFEIYQQQRLIGKINIVAVVVVVCEIILDKYGLRFWL